MPANTLESEIEPVPDLPVASAGTVDGLLSIDSICWENYPGAMREQAIEKATALARAEMDSWTTPSDEERFAADLRVCYPSQVAV